MNLLFQALAKVTVYAKLLIKDSWNEYLMSQGERQSTLPLEISKRIG